MEGFKTVEAQQFFAKNMYLDFMTLRFGITPCCYKDPEGSMIKKYLCDWMCGLENKWCTDRDLNPDHRLGRPES